MRRLILGISTVMALGTASITPPNLAWATDIGLRQADESGKLDRQVYRDALLRRAALYGLRAHFDVISSDDIPSLLRSDAVHLSSSSQVEAERDSVERDLLAEGSYYIVSLRYLIEFGSANWPADREASNYQNDALVTLEALEQKWLEAVENDGDLFRILRSVDLINAWTEGSTVITPALDDFSGLSTLVDTTIANYGPWATS